MGSYATWMRRTASATLSVGSIAQPAAALKRIRLYDFTVGSEGAPADVANLWQWQRLTVAGTSTAVTPIPLDPADGAASAVCGENHTVDPTVTANSFPFMFALNQKATYRWIAAPGGEIVIPATNANGLALRTPTAGSSVAISASCHFME